MNNRFISLLCVLFFSLFVACQDKSMPLAGESEHGYKYEIRKGKTSGASPKDGQLILLYNGGFVGDKAVFGQYSKHLPPLTYRLPLRSHIDSLPAIQQKDMWPIYDALTMIGIGDSIFLWMPLDSLQQENLPNGIDKGATEVKLFMSIAGYTTTEQEEAKAKAREEDLAGRLPSIQKMLATEIPLVRNGNPEGELMQLESGVKIWIKEPGTNEAVLNGERVLVNYYGALTNGKRFDDSFKVGNHYSFRTGAGQVIPGLDEAILNLHHGSTSLIFIPWDLAYGEEGAPQGFIPPRADLVFYLEVL